MRLIAFLVGLSVCTAALAQHNFAGTKSDVIPTSASSQAGGLMPFFQMLIALGIVFALLKFLLPRMIAKVGKKLVTSSTSSIKVEESASFAGGNLYIVSARDKSLLLSVTTSGVTCLADLTPLTPVQDEPLFLDILERARVEPSAPEALEISEKARLEDALRMLSDAKGGVMGGEVCCSAVVEIPETPGATRTESVEAFTTRLPDDAKPLKPILAEPQPWQPRRLTREDREEEIEAVMRRLQQLSS